MSSEDSLFFRSRASATMRKMTSGTEVFILEASERTCWLVSWSRIILYFIPPLTYVESTRWSWRALKILAMNSSTFIQWTICPFSVRWLNDLRAQVCSSNTAVSDKPRRTETLRFLELDSPMYEARISKSWAKHNKKAPESPEASINILFSICHNCDKLKKILKFSFIGYKTKLFMFFFCYLLPLAPVDFWEKRVAFKVSVDVGYVGNRTERQSLLKNFRAANYVNVFG